MAVPVLGLSYLRGTPKRRTLGGVPISRDDLPSVAAMPPNIHHASDPLSALALVRGGALADGLHYGAAGERLTAPAEDPPGHAHATEGTYLRWREVATWSPSSLDDGAGTHSRGASWVTSSTSRVVCVALVALPEGISRVYPRACVTCDTDNMTSVTVTAEIFGDDDTAGIKSVMHYLNAASADLWALDRWREGSPVELSRLNFTGEPRRIVVRWSALHVVRADAPIAQIHALQIGTR